jgi:hypothetical protein
MYLNFDSVWHSDKGVHLFSRDDVSLRTGLSASLDVYTIAPSIRLAPELGWGYENLEDGVMLPEYSTAQLTAHHLSLSVRANYEAIGWIEPGLRLGGGASISSIALRAASTSDRYEQDDISPFFLAGAALLLRTPDSFFSRRKGGVASFAAGVLAEGGYLLSPSLDVAPEPTSDPGRIPSSVAALGELGRSGPYLRISAFLRF